MGPMMFVKLIEDVLSMHNVAGTSWESTYVSVTMDTKEIPMEKLVSVRFLFFHNWLIFYMFILQLLVLSASLLV